MIADIIKNNLVSIHGICEKFGVKSLHLFGSAADNTLTSKSDIDFLVDYFKDSEGLPKAPFDYFDILFSLENITGKKVDLVVKDALRNSYFINSFNNNKVLIYEKRD